MFDPHDWYWMADDGRVYASARRAIVTTQDPLANDRIAQDRFTIWPHDEAGEQTDAALQEVVGSYGLYIDLPALKLALCARIDAAAERERAKYITAGAGQAMEYQQAAAEAEALLAALVANPNHEPDAADYPMLVASLGIDGATLADVAATVATMHAQWRVVGSAIRALRLGAKTAVMAAADEAAARAAAVVIWPNPEI